MELGSVCMHGDVLMTKCHLSPTVCFDLYRRPLSAGTDLTFNYNAPTSESSNDRNFQVHKKIFLFRSAQSLLPHFNGVHAIVIRPGPSVNCI